jgi:hypothetical protein
MLFSNIPSGYSMEIHKPAIFPPSLTNNTMQVYRNKTEIVNKYGNPNLLISFRTLKDFIDLDLKK